MLISFADWTFPLTIKRSCFKRFSVGAPIPESAGAAAVAGLAFGAPNTLPCSLGGRMKRKPHFRDRSPKGHVIPVARLRKNKALQ